MGAKRNSWLKSPDGGVAHEKNLQTVAAKMKKWAMSGKADASKKERAAAFFKQYPKLA